MIDFKKIKFISRPDSWFDEGTEAFIDFDEGAGNCIAHDFISDVFNGIHEGKEDEEMCNIFEFDWIDENNNCINSNIPNFGDLIVYENYIVEDFETGQKYNWLLNKKL